MQRRKDEAGSGPEGKVKWSGGCIIKKGRIKTMEGAREGERPGHRLTWIPVRMRSAHVVQALARFNQTTTGMMSRVMVNRTGI